MKEAHLVSRGGYILRVQNVAKVVDAGSSMEATIETIPVGISFQWSLGGRVDLDASLKGFGGSVASRTVKKRLGLCRVIKTKKLALHL